MNKRILLILIILTVAFPGLVFCQKNADEKGWTGNINLFLGAKFLESDDWQPVENHAEGGILLDFRKKSWWWFSIAADLLYSRDEETVRIDAVGFGVFDAEVEAQTVELNLGIRKVWENFRYVRPFIGAGPGVVHARLCTESLGESVDDSDTGFAAWINAGIYATLQNRVNLGLDLRYSRADINLFAADAKAGGWHIGALIGYHW